jgi:hypothetical protein
MTNRENAGTLGSDQIDAEHQATELAVGGSNPSRRAFPGDGEAGGYRWVVLAEVPSQVSARPGSQALTVGCVAQAPAA